MTKEKPMSSSASKVVDHLRAGHRVEDRFGGACLIGTDNFIKEKVRPGTMVSLMNRNVIKVIREEGNPTRWVLVD